MRVCLLGLLVVVACGGGNGSDDQYPDRGGGGGGGGGGHGRADAALPDGATGDVTGHVCVTSDLRDWGACATAGVLGITVTIGAATAQTNDAGAFTITLPSPVPATARMTGVDIVASYAPVDVLGGTIELIAADKTAFASVLVGTGIDAEAGDGTLLIEVLRDGSRTAGMTADTNPPPGILANNTVYYDNPADPNLWVDTATGLDSKALATDLPVGTVTMTAGIGVDSGAADFVVHADAITFGTLDVIP